ncbi:hypothetical protein ACH5RR_001950 [Cinchona calisaya]|uniref:Uncharacterized protein n=1 Tax=Cinchona calisaya TaxID=153742 RepID=A0ABD3B572_9GENT
MMMKNSSSSSSMIKSWLTEPEFDAACQLIQLLSGDSHSAGAGAGAAAESEEEDTGSISKGKYKTSTTSDHRVINKNELAEENVSDLHDHGDEISISSSESAIRVAEDLDVCEVYSSRKRKFRSILDLYAITKPLLFKKAAT